MTAFGRPEMAVGVEVCVDRRDHPRYRAHARIVGCDGSWVQPIVEWDDGERGVVLVGYLHRWYPPEVVELARVNAVAAGFEPLTEPQRTGWFQPGGLGFHCPAGEFPLGLVDLYGHEQPPCAECGEPTWRDQLPHCMSCQFWLRLIGADRSRMAVIDGSHYTDGGRRGGDRSVLGFGGQEFRLRWHDGRTVDTNNLWFQGEVPDRFRDRLPDDCVFES